MTHINARPSTKISNLPSLPSEPFYHSLLCRDVLIATLGVVGECGWSVMRRCAIMIFDLLRFQSSLIQHVDEAFTLSNTIIQLCLH